MIAVSGMAGSASSTTLRGRNMAAARKLAEPRTEIMAGMVQCNMAPGTGVAQAAKA